MFRRLAVILGWLSAVPAALWAVSVGLPGGGGGVALAVANSWTATQTFVDANFTGNIGLAGTRLSTDWPIEAKKILRVSGSSGSATTGKGIELAGDLSNENYVTSYNRDASAYMILNIAGNPINLNPSAQGVINAGYFLGLYTRTSLQLNALAPTAAGIIVFNSTNNKVCVSTGTGAGAWVSPHDGTTACD